MLIRTLWVACLLAATGSAVAAPLAVAVSILPQKYFVERIGGDAVRVEVMVKPGQSPATYEPTPQQMAALARARAYFRIGVPFEEVWMKRIQAAAPGMKVVDTREGITLLPMAVRHADAPGHAHPPGAHGQLDPHIWTSPPLVKRQAATIRDALIALDPDRRALFEANYARFAADLEALDAEIRGMLAGKRERRFMVFHPAWGYFARAYDLQQIPIEIEGKEPGPKALAAMIDAAKRDGVRVVFVQSQFSRTAADAVAKAIGGEVVAVDPLAEDFIAGTRSAAGAFARAMK
jgi:zinc transport system substrate-binding protein